MPARLEGLRVVDRRRPVFIVSLNWADVMTLGSVLVACLGLLAAGRGRLSLAIAIMLGAMLIDIFDGALARRLGLASEFGRYLDSFADVFTYLALPLFVLYQFGMQDPLSLAALFVFLAAGILRLTRFNLEGILTGEQGDYYLGLPVTYSTLAVALAFPLWHWLGATARWPIGLALLAMSAAMLVNWRYPKPRNLAGLGAVVLLVGGVYLALYLGGVAAP